VGLWAVALGWLVWRLGRFSSGFAALGVEPPYATEAMFDFASWAQGLTGLVVSALVLAGAAAGSLWLDRPRSLRLAVASSVVALVLVAAGVELVCWFPPPSPVGEGELGMCFNARVQHVWGPGLMLLSALAFAGAGVVVTWAGVAVRSLFEPQSASISAEVGRTLFAAAPFVIAVHVLWDTRLSRPAIASFGLPLMHPDAAALTATGTVVLAAALARLSLRRPAPNSAAGPARGSAVTSSL
jgi:hypothetical protein